MPGGCGRKRWRSTKRMVIPCWKRKQCVAWGFVYLLCVASRASQSLMPAQTKEIEDISLEMDRVAVFKQKMTEMVSAGAGSASLRSLQNLLYDNGVSGIPQKLVDSKEEQAVRAAFEKFDADNSGWWCPVCVQHVVRFARTSAHSTCR